VVKIALLISIEEINNIKMKFNVRLS
jgi:hypothetical protein